MSVLPRKFPVERQHAIDSLSIRSGRESPIDARSDTLLFCVTFRGPACVTGTGKWRTAGKLEGLAPGHTRRSQTHDE